MKDSDQYHKWVEWSEEDNDIGTGVHLRSAFSGASRARMTCADSGVLRFAAGLGRSTFDF